MARISGVDLPANKSILISLTYIYGIGLSKSKLILDAIDINPRTKTNQLNEEQILKIRNELAENYLVEGELRSQVGRNIKRLIIKLIIIPLLSFKIYYYKYFTFYYIY